LCKFPKPLYIQKFKFYSEIIFPPIPAHPAQPRSAPAGFAPQAAVRALGPLSLSSLGVFAKRRHFFMFAQSINGVSSLSHVAAKKAPPVRSTSFLAPADPNHVSTAPRHN
jgi:hypothetical protein